MRKVFVIIVVGVLASLGASAQTAFEVKQTISILGDSYSTFRGYIPEEYATWYSSSSLDRTDVIDVKQTWWWKTIKDGGYKLGVNDSYSGATISYYGYNDEDYADRSFITRVTRLGNPDIILIFGATNDSWTGGRIGEYLYSDFKRSDLFTYRPALAKLLQSAQERYPNVKLYFIINTELLDEITESTKVICDHYGVDYIELYDIEKLNGHPTIKGMTTISEQVLNVLKKGY
ncbi:SGNH/GDSL hydrolase family protein [Mangrovibacterium lignilyticum]|uniref:SGNH/GDSL hydrolase family protein n=1 Tax=Mangrovibacterium lignilyticum TaxID=2668052 RepID=UPI0013CF9FAA|nr:SGNH/GDSL hydrolase family protein [Mangrovibacterium lignilyticum]